MYLIFRSCPATRNSTATFSPFFRSSKVPSHFTGRQKCAVDDHVADDALGGHGVQQGGGLTPMAATFGQCCHDISETGHVWYRTILKPQEAARKKKAGYRISVILLQKMMIYDDMICDWDIMTYEKFTCWVHPIEYKHIIHINLSWFGFMMTLSPAWYKYQGFNFCTARPHFV